MRGGGGICNGGACSTVGVGGGMGDDGVGHFDEDEDVPAAAA